MRLENSWLQTRSHNQAELLAVGDKVVLENIPADEGFLYGAPTQASRNGFNRPPCPGTVEAGADERWERLAKFTVETASEAYRSVLLDKAVSSYKIPDW